MILLLMFFGILRILNDLILYKINNTTNTVHQVEVKTKIGKYILVTEPINWFGNSYITIYVKKQILQLITKKILVFC